MTEQELKDEREQAVKRGGEIYADHYMEGLIDGRNLALRQFGVMQGDFFILSSEKGYTPSQRKEAMQVMECWDKVMTVKCKGGCMTKEYDHFEKVTDLSGFRSVHRYDGEMEDRRSYHPA